MTNTQLLELFKTIAEVDNCFDREIMLKKAKKQYKKSYFYRETKMNIHRAYAVFTLSGLSKIAAILSSPILSAFAKGDVKAIIEQIEEGIKNFDKASLDGIIAYVNDNFSTDLEAARALIGEYKGVAELLLGSLK